MRNRVVVANDQYYVASAHNSKGIDKTKNRDPTKSNHVPVFSFVFFDLAPQ